MDLTIEGGERDQIRRCDRCGWSATGRFAASGAHNGHMQEWELDATSHPSNV